MPYATVKDKRTMGACHGGQRLRGSFVVYVHGKAVWSEADTWLAAKYAKRRAEDLTRLLQAAYDAGVRWRAARNDN